MNAGLRFLLLRQPLGWLRRLRRRARGTKGVLVIAGVALIAVFLIGPQIFLVKHDPDAALESVDAFRTWGPLLLTVMAVLGVSAGTGLYFKPAEVDFLFPAPIGRRELLLYHVLGRVLIVLLSAIWVGIFTVRFAPHWYGGFVGLFLGLTFLQLTAQLGSLILATLSAHVAKRARAALVLGLVVALAAGILVMRLRVPDSDLGGAVRSLAESQPAAVLTAPARVFVEVFTSTTAADFLLWSGVGLALLLVLFGLIAILDVAYTETAVTVSRAVRERLARMRSGGVGGSAEPTPRKRRSVRRVAFLRGAGPILWQKCVEARRRGWRLVGNLAFMLVFPVVFIVAMASKDREGQVFGGAAGWVVVVMTVLMNQNLTLDFRRDLDRMPYLKSLPLRPGYVALGQVIPTAVLLALVHFVLVLALQLGFRIPTIGVEMLLLVLLPFNFTAVALDNLLFLWMPYRVTPNEAGQTQFLGRMMVVMFAKLLALMLACGVAALFGWMAWALTDGNRTATGLAGALVLTVEAGLLLWLTGRAFAGFDVTVDLPA